MIARIRAAALACFSALALQATVGTPAAHAAYPEQAIKLVVPFTPVGATDAVARLLANRLSGKLGQAVIVENRPGASTVIGANAVAQAQPDGYTLMLSGSTTYTVLPALKRDLPYDPRGSFEHIAIVALAPVVLLVQNSLPAETAQQAADLARRQTASGGLMYGTFGPGSAPHLVGEMFAEAAGAKMTPVPYKGSAQFITALIGGEIALGVDTVSSAPPQVKAGKVRALAVTGEHRVPQLPDVPTFIESGLPGVSMVGWYGLVAPARTPAPVLRKLNDAVADIMRDPQVQRAVNDLALEPVYLDGPAFKARMEQELQTFGEVGRRADIKLD